MTRLLLIPSALEADRLLPDPRARMNGSLRGPTLTSIA